ncbi:phosphatidate cytidylyltransferase [Microbacterium capsulatum]|uniref:Phosphatidate cytidylyltransferase n=1 Tax=Microbacterium capsulatum TaxID=3041921 RepID=A0ABU0XDT1_9MICO|nr:phosphatidate cytidylyltransferase [Microbacterium sp. ASV81]MDQ4213284.1 phosphatidate cytidylyltransferase [Microbacterium sp. ASV81]
MSTPGGDDEPRIPPRPPLPPRTRSDQRQRAGENPPPSSGESVPPRTGDNLHAQWQARKAEIETHVSHARDQIDQANERIIQRTGRNLVLAVGVGLLFGAVVVSSLVLAKWSFALIAVAIVELAIWELVLALRAGGRKVDLWPQLVVGAALVAGGYFADPWLTWVMLFVAVFAVVVWRTFGQMVARDGRIYGDVLTDVLAGGFVQVYVAFLGAIILMLLRQPRGEWWVLGFIIVVVVTDTAAYASGLLFGRGGRHPMAPRVSPKKTWEGFAGAVVGSLAAGALIGQFMLEIPWWAGLIFGAVLVASATLGDLGESLLKRDLGIKDMSSWLPGHGGLLDRLDSILPSSVFALALFHILTPLAGAR